VTRVGAANAACSGTLYSGQDQDPVAWPGLARRVARGTLGRPGGGWGALIDMLPEVRPPWPSRFPVTVRALEGGDSPGCHRSRPAVSARVLDESLGPGAGLRAPRGLHRVRSCTAVTRRPGPRFTGTAGDGGGHGAGARLRPNRRTRPACPAPGEPARWPVCTAGADAACAAAVMARVATRMHSTCRMV
jgi:hypothetical protein